MGEAKTLAFSGIILLSLLGDTARLSNGEPSSICRGICSVPSSFVWGNGGDNNSTYTQNLNLQQGSSFDWEDLP